MKQLYLIIAILFISYENYADMVDNGNQQFYGAIISVDSTRILLKERCGSTTRTFFWTQITSITFNTRCDHPGYTMSRSPATAEEICTKRKVFMFLIKSSNQVGYADNFVQADNFITITYGNGSSQRIPAEDADKYIDWVIYADVCVNNIPQNTSILN